ncbi:PRC-barrel domain containing protein [Candidatus Uhrbacteria bacterium]|nr:MAG: PRC-barrel domain containing protein [Candidatus Uhrbacteria bacterium]
MILNSKAMSGLPVETRSGQSLGRIASFDVDADTGRIKTFHVKSGNLVSGLLGDELMVDWGQVLELTEMRLVVADSAVPAGERALAKAATAAPPATFMEG